MGPAMRCCIMLLGFPGMVLSQAPIQLKAAIGILAEDFTRLNSVRELADGRALVTDSWGDARLLLADFRTGKAERIGQPGPGPREYVNPPRRVLPLANDSTLFVSGDRPPRWSLMHGSTIVETFPPESRVFIRANDAIGADTFGNVLARRQDPPRTTRKSPTLSIYAYEAILANRRTGRIETIATLTGDSYEISAGGRSFNQVTFTVPEAATLFMDGWVAIVRLDPYRVEWRSPAGTWIKGPPLPARPVKVDAREIAAFRDRGGSTSMPMGDVIPPLGYQLPLPAPGGILAIRRMPWSGAPNTDYDFVDRRGQLVATLNLPAREKIVGFGRNSVYIVATDDDDVQHLRKHPWP